MVFVEEVVWFIGVISEIGLGSDSDPCMTYLYALKSETLTAIETHSSLERRVVSIEKRHHIASLWIRFYSRSNCAVL